MALTKTEQAKYPFMLSAAEEVRREDLDIENLDSPAAKPILDRAINRIEEALENNPPQVTYRSREEDTEIPSFPAAIVLAAASASDYVKRRYALGEARRASELLKEENKENVLEIAKVFNWRIRSSEETIGGRKFDYALSFADFLANTTSFHDEPYKLVNRALLNSEVYLTRREVARLLQEEIRRRIERRLSTDSRSMLSEGLLARVEKLKQRYAGYTEKARFEELPKEVMNDAFSPCVRQLYAAAKSGRHLSHHGRFTLTSFLLGIGMKPAEVVDLFRSASDFNERMTRYQVEHIAGARGSRTKYTPPTCDTLRTHGLCPGPDDLCSGIRHPLTYYRRKTRTLKKEIPVS